MLYPRHLALPLLLATVIAGPARSETPQSAASPENALQSFASQWDDTLWLPKTSGNRPPYMRPADDAGWKARMLTLQSLVMQGDKGAEHVRQRLREGTAAERALAAQALGYLRAPSARDDLLGAAEQDSEPVVRLYAADSLGKLGDASSPVDWQRIATREVNRDVKRHLGYAQSRAGDAIAESAVKQLADWDADRIDSARVGEAAPDFELPSLSGETLKLRDFLGKRAVVLIFLYGETCPVCHGQVSQFRSRVADIEQLGAQLVMVDPHEAYSARHFLKESGADAADLRFPLLLDPAHVVSAIYGVAFQNRIHTELSNRPATFVIDRAGVIRYVRRATTFSDRPTPDEVLNELRKLPAE